MKVLGGEGLGDIHELKDVKLFVEPGHFGGEGFFSNLADEAKRAVSKVQSNPLVRQAEKKAVSYGAKTVRGMAGVRWTVWAIQWRRPSGSPRWRPR